LVLVLFFGFCLAIFSYLTPFFLIAQNWLGFHHDGERLIERSILLVLFIISLVFPLLVSRRAIWGLGTPASFLAFTF